MKENGHENEYDNRQIIRWEAVPLMFRADLWKGVQVR